MTDVGGEGCAEEWRPVTGFSGYEVSSSGRFRRVTSARGATPYQVLGGTVSNNGYVRVTLRVNGKRYTKLLSRLVCEAFHGNPTTENPNCLHSNGNRLDNRSSNLRWGNQSENCADAAKHGTWICGERQGSSILNREQVISIRKKRKTGMKIREIADEFGVSNTCISSIVNGYNWTHLS